jgi:mannosyltransferase OCH1-like enzyme
MIPKHIYQTWKTKILSPNVEAVLQKIQQLNPEYTMHLYDDNDMLVFLQENYAPIVVKAFESMAVGAAKADLMALLYIICIWWCIFGY